MKLKAQDNRNRLNPEAFQTLHDHYRERLACSMRRVVKNRELAEDIASAAFEKAFAKRDQFRRESAPASWLYSIAMNYARHCWRWPQHVSLDVIRDGSPNHPAESGSVLDALERRETCGKLKEALLRLPIRFRQTLEDHFVHGRSVAEVAKRYRIPAGTVLSRISTGKRLLRNAWRAVT
jgi:RNA polymerase sigma-70 factor (ECF subfamily)